jgi:hypothetical protein
MARSRAAKNSMVEMRKKPKQWIQSALNPQTKGALYKALGVAQDKKIPEKKLEKATHSKNPLTRKRANLAETLRKFH